jgi:tripartite-type tricarboxylate transporter receptor subunit TctC
VVPDFEFSSWNRFSALAETPEPILAAIQTELAAFAKSREVAERLSKLGIIPGGLTQEESAAVIRKDYDSFAAAVKAAGIEPPK